MIILFGRCAVPGVDKNGTGVLWNSTEVLSSVPLTEDGALDSCHYIDVTTNSSVKCSRWVYDDTYYQSSKAIEVQHNMQHRDVSWWFLLLFHNLHSLIWCIYYLQWIMELPLYLTLLNIFTLLLFSPQSKISVIHFLHLKLFICFLLDPQISCPLQNPLTL
jgi:hypothetical protein